MKLIMMRMRMRRKKRRKSKLCTRAEQEQKLLPKQNNPYERDHDQGLSIGRAQEQLRMPKLFKTMITTSCFKQ